MKRILIVDDDVNVGNLIEELLTREGYAVARAYSGTEAVMYLSSHSPDLILLDLMLPGMSGEDVLARARGIPAIVVSARADVESKISLLYGGAVDYITKPFDTGELSARVAVRLRSGGGEARDVIRAGGLTLDAASRSVEAGGARVRLTRTEYAILRLLMANAGQVITKTQLLDRISNDTPDCTESSLKTHVSHLRTKLKAACGRDLVESVWGIGYKLDL